MKSNFIAIFTEAQLVAAGYVLLGMLAIYIFLKLNDKVTPLNEKMARLKNIDSEINPKAHESSKLTELRDIVKLVPKDPIPADMIEAFKVNQDPTVANDAKEGFIYKYPEYSIIDEYKILITCDPRVQAHEIKKHTENFLDELIKRKVNGLTEDDRLILYFERYKTDFTWILEKPKPNPILDKNFVRDHWEKFVEQYSKYRCYETYSIPIGVAVSDRTRVHPEVAPVDNMMKWETCKSPMLGTFGKTRSGKTAHLRTLVVITKITYPDTLFMVVDGKIGGQDFSDINKHWGVYPEEAHVTAGENPMINFDNCVYKTYDIWKERIDLMGKFKSETGEACSTFAEYNAICEKHGYPRIPMLIVIMDEMPEWSRNSKPKPEAAVTRKGDSSWKIVSALMKVAGFVGIRMIFASQTNVQPFFPAFIRDGITTFLFFNFPTDKVPNDYSAIRPGNLGNGHFYLCQDGVTDASTGTSPICQLPFAGTKLSFFDKLPDFTGERYQYDEELVASVPDDMDDYNCARIARNLWFKREGMEPTSLKFDMYWSFLFTFKGVQRRFIVANKKYLSEIGYENMNAVFPDRAKEKAVLLITGAASEAEAKLSEMAKGQGYIPLFETLAEVMFTQAFKLNLDKKPELVISKWLERIEVKALTVISPIEESSGDKIEPTQKCLDYIINIKGNSKGNKALKGDLFEKWILSLLRALGYFAYSTREVLASEAFRHFGITMGDLGGDVLYSRSEIFFSSETTPDGKIKGIVKSDSEIILAQLKNWVGEIDQHVITRTGQAKNYYQAQKAAIYLIKGGIKKGANVKAELELSGIEIVNYSDLVAKIPGNIKPKTDLEKVRELNDKGLKQQQIADTLGFAIGKVNKLIKQIKEAKVC